MKLFVKVKVLNDNYISDNVKSGDIGYILDDYKEGHYEVQFWDESKTPPESLAVISVLGKDIVEVHE